jgi:hypothetical protein
MPAWLAYVDYYLYLFISSITMLRIFSLLVLLQLSFGLVSAQDMRLSLQIMGKCADCEHSSIESTLWSIEGINSISYNSGGNMVIIIYNQKTTTKERILKELQGNDYRVNGAGTGCCMLAEQGKAGVVENYASQEDDDDDDPILKDDEAIKSIDNVGAEIKAMNVEEAIKTEAAKNIEEVEKELHAAAEASTKAVEETDAEEKSELDAELDAEMSNLNNINTDLD